MTAARAILYFLLLPLLTACAVRTDEACRQIDWFERGLLDGRTGRGAEQLDLHGRSCGAVLPDAARWRAGWQQGLASYCSGERGWREGLNNSPYEGACQGQPGGAEFERQHRLGQQASRLQAEIAANQRLLRQLEQALQQPGAEARATPLRDQMLRLELEQQRLRTELDALQAQVPASSR